MDAPEEKLSQFQELKEIDLVTKQIIPNSFDNFDLNAIAHSTVKTIAKPANIYIKNK